MYKVRNAEDLKNFNNNKNWKGLVFQIKKGRPGITKDNIFTYIGEEYIGEDNFKKITDLLSGMGFEIAFFDLVEYLKGIISFDEDFLECYFCLSDRESLFVEMGQRNLYSTIYAGGYYFSVEESFQIKDVNEVCKKYEITLPEIEQALFEIKYKKEI